MILLFTYQEAKTKRRMECLEQLRGSICPKLSYILKYSTHNGESSLKSKADTDCESQRGKKIYSSIRLCQNNNGQKVESKVSESCLEDRPSKVSNGGRFYRKRLQCVHSCSGFSYFSVCFLTLVCPYLFSVPMVWWVHTSLSTVRYIYTLVCPHFYTYVYLFLLQYYLFLVQCGHTSVFPYLSITILHYLQTSVRSF